MSECIIYFIQVCPNYIFLIVNKNDLIFFLQDIEVADPINIVVDMKTHVSCFNPR